MDPVWKCFFILLFIVISYIVVWRDPTTISHRHNIDIEEKDSHSVNKTNPILERKRRDYMYRTGSLGSINQSYTLTRKIWKTKRKFKDENNWSKPLIPPVFSTEMKTHINAFDISETASGLKLNKKLIYMIRHKQLWKTKHHARIILIKIH